ncbi:PLD3 [Branchiostoma lanceolatum]|uniref:PLD3 protein n=1 Tax=Branchiostoma lanceolatum TaxID=7740 RepID=A0A8J9ZWU1_BRALA|nr:PLD3 [Branchiostoma lanceolatum]
MARHRHHHNTQQPLHRGKNSTKKPVMEEDKGPAETTPLNNSDDYHVRVRTKPLPFYRNPASCLMLVALLAGVVVFASMVVIFWSRNTAANQPICTDPCKLTLVESIPLNLTYAAGQPTHPSIYSAWMRLVQNAQHSIDIASFYWTLQEEDLPHDESASEGQAFYNELLRVGKGGSVKIRIAQDIQEGKIQNDTAFLAKVGAAQVRSLDFSRFYPWGGVLHTKMITVDGRHFYVGSANLDWRSLTQVKELGAVVEDCPSLAQDVGKLFSVYWDLGKPGADLPPSWPAAYQTNYNLQTPVQVAFNGTDTNTFLSSAPPEFCPKGRTTDIDAIVGVIRSAQKFVYVAVMDYVPTTQFHGDHNIYWPVIDDELRRAAFDRHVEVRLMASKWNYTRAESFRYLWSLQDLNFTGKDLNINVSVKLFEVPDYPSVEEQFDHSRVNHNKYMVTDQVAYIGTSNWSADYFINTGGIGLVINQTSGQFGKANVEEQLRAVFERDWNSPYAHFLDHYSEHR